MLRQEVAVVQAPPAVASRHTAAVDAVGEQAATVVVHLLQVERQVVARRLRVGPQHAQVAYERCERVAAALQLDGHRVVYPPRCSAASHCAVRRRSLNDAASMQQAPLLRNASGVLPKLTGCRRPIDPPLMSTDPC